MSSLSCEGRWTLDDVERISKGKASKAKTGSRKVPHRLQAGERTVRDVYLLCPLLSFNCLLKLIYKMQVQKCTKMYICDCTMVLRSKKVPN